MDRAFKTGRCAMKIKSTVKAGGITATGVD